MSKRLDRIFSQPAKGKTRLIAYLMAGDPTPETTLRRLKGLADYGVDVLELGVPFSDPIADGPVIQSAGERALKGGMTLVKTLEIVREFRVLHETPVLLMSYLNPLLRYGWGKFVKDAVEAGVDGLILPDLPWKEGTNLRTETKRLVGTQLSFIPIVAQTSQEEDLLELSIGSQGFIYVLSRNGITGGEAEISAKVTGFINGLKQHTQLPRCVGFGIQTAKQVHCLAEYCDGVIIGSAIVRQFSELDKKELSELELRKGETEILEWVAEINSIK
ncbi:MAG TPA: tryptophan synthase subunit alpha [Desulfosporosinus sp.]|jgi:tryptophan synthase alpha chain|nr:tryptophan synthase subunit alpha [Desulfosporosinus sp.]